MILLASGLLIFVLDVVVALVATSPSYSWRHSMISDLGASRCITRNTFTTCAPDARVFNAGLILAGLLVLSASWKLARRWDPLFGAGTVVLGLGLIILGACPSTAWHPVHMVGAVLALPTTALCMLASEMRVPARQAPRGGGIAVRRVRIGGCAVALLGCLDQLWGSPPVPAGIAEAVAVACVAGVMTLEAIRLRRTGRPAAAGRPPRTTPEAS